MRNVGAVILGVLLMSSFVTTARAGDTPTAPPDVNAILSGMKAALEPQRPSVRELEIVLRDAEGVETQWTARELRKVGPNGGRLAMVILTPPGIAGSAVLIAEDPKGPDVQWEYLPAVRRVRKIVPIGAFQPLLGTDFTYGDLGFVSLKRQSAKLLGTETMPDGRKVYRVEERPENTWYYSRIVDLIATDTLLPLRRAFYSPAGELWKVESIDVVTTIDGVPTPIVVRMEDQFDRGSTTIHAVRVQYTSDLPEHAFEPAGLPKLLDDSKAFVKK